MNFQTLFGVQVGGVYVRLQTLGRESLCVVMQRRVERDPPIVQGLRASTFSVHDRLETRPVVR